MYNLSMITRAQKETLIDKAKEALNNDFAIKTQSNYSAAVLTQKGNVYAACSYASDTHSLTIHGEQAALIHAAAHGEDEIVAIAIASKEDKNHNEFSNPCHMCKQLLYESSHRNKLPMLILLTNSHNEVKEVDLSEMISYPWPA